MEPHPPPAGEREPGTGTAASTFELRAIGRVRSTLTRREDAPRQGWAGAPEAWIELDEAVRDGLLGIEAGTEVVLLTWLHLSERDVLQVRPHHDPEHRARGVFATRSPVRPNPIGIHPVRVLEVDGARLRVTPLEAVDGTPVVDIKAAMKERLPVLKDMLNRRGGDLSGGQQQQLAIGRAMVMRPKLLVLDEPTEGIQPSIIKDIGRAIAWLRDQGGLAILLVEQYFDFARDLADTYCVMDRGEVVQSGSGTEMRGAQEDDLRRRIAV